MAIEINLMKQKLQSALSPRRYEHSLSVCEEAVKLACIYGAEVEKARIAGLLHDCAKDYPPDMQLRLCKEYHVKTDSLMKKQPELIHAPLGAEVASREYLVDDIEILDAMHYHTTGRAEMSLLEKLVFIADYIEPKRKAYEGLEEVRKLSRQDIDAAMIAALTNSCAIVKNKNKLVHPLSIEALDYLKNRRLVIWTDI